MFMGLMRATKERPQDLALRRTIIQAIHQHHRLRQGWTFTKEQTGLTALLISGLLDTDSVTRRKSEEVVLFAVQKKGAKHFEQYVTVTNRPAQSSGATPVRAREPGRQ